MATLTETAYHIRRAVTYGTIILVAGIVFKIVLSAFGGYWKASHPPPPPAPTVAFGKIPALEFSKLGTLIAASSSAYSYKIETVEGKTVTLPNSGKVYYMPAIPSNLKALDRAKEKVAKIGFTNEPMQITSEIYTWIDPSNQWRSLTMNIYTGNLSISYNFLADQTLLIDKNVPNLQNAFVEAKNFLGQLGIPTDDIEGVENINFQSDPTIGAYLKFSISDFTPATSQSEADAVRINLPKKKLDDLPFISLYPYNALVSFTFSGQRDEKKHILLANYTNFPIDKNTMATYPLKKFEEAIDELKSGSGFVANYKGQDTNVTIRKAYIAYFDPPIPLTYIQPIIVLEGDDSFVAYVQGVSDEWINK